MTTDPRSLSTDPQLLPVDGMTAAQRLYFLYLVREAYGHTRTPGQVAQDHGVDLDTATRAQAGGLICKLKAIINGVPV